MCGIAGIAGNGAARHEQALMRMLPAIGHRGPDGEGKSAYDDCVLGHKRLSIVDLALGAQPMQDSSGELALTFNGEIYGYKSIRSRMEQYPFRTSSDTELVIALYARYGMEMMAHLPGMFSFALWDNRDRSLFCARDRFGEKPFYYALAGDTIIFASEINAISASGLVKPEIDPATLSSYLQKLYVPPDRTVYKNIFTLPPAHFLVMKGGKVAVKRYWSPNIASKEIRQQEALDRFRSLLEESVKKQLVADVPVGAFLSGGLDSGTIVAIASRLVTGKLKTFSFGFEDEKNELAGAREIAKRYGTEHHEFLDSDYDISDLFMTMASVYDEPFADSSNIPTYLISKFASRMVKVAITGDGGDELLGGYDWYRSLLRMVANYEKSGALKRMVFSGPGVMMARLAGGSIAEKVDLFRAYRAGHLFSRLHASQNKYFSSAQLLELGLPVPPQNFVRGDDNNSVDDAMKMDVADYMPGDILVKIDRASMAHGLELRSPFLDVALAEFCLALPWQLKLHQNQGKLLLREAVRDLLPPEHFTAPKQGFGAPVGKWLKDPKLHKLKSSMLHSKDSAIFKFLDQDAALKYDSLDNYQTWSLLCLAAWLEKHPG